MMRNITKKSKFEPRYDRHAASDREHTMEGRDMHYSMIIQWDPRDDIYVVTVPELPGCVTHGATYEEAVMQGQDAIDTWVYGEDPATLPAPSFYPLDDDGNSNMNEHPASSGSAAAS